MTTAFAPPSSDVELFDDAALHDPYSRYAELRELGDVVQLTAYDMYAIPRYHPMREALANWQVFSSAEGVMMNDHVNTSLKGIVLCTDPPEHDVMRKVLAAPLRPDQLRLITPSVRAEADAVVERLVERGQFDAATDLAQHLPLTIVSTLVGLGDFGRERMLEWAAATFDSQGPMNQRTRDAFPKLNEVVSYTLNEVTADKVDPTGWVAALYAAAERGELPVDKPSKMVMDYVAPALDTTIFATSSAISLFAQYPDQWDLVRADPTLIPHAINEVVRLESPIQQFTRLTTQDIEIGGYHLSAGSRVLMLFGSGNRDERKYPNPERFDVRRKPSDHLAFGHGVHACVGMNLARLEIRLLLEALAAKVKRFDIVRSEVAMNNTLRGLAELVVTVR